MPGSVRYPEHEAGIDLCDRSGGLKAGGAQETGPFREMFEDSALRKARADEGFFESHRLSVGSLDGSPNHLDELPAADAFESFISHGF